MATSAGERICERNRPADTQVSAEGGEEVLQGQSRDSPADPHGAARGEASVPLQTLEVHGGADLCLQPREDPTQEQGDA